ncbi:hypothetical protein CONPUDRAFT_85438 [Coniophora puteana RWD-64-598 SS2]|uniref:Ser-Thr-rich glycosyl-phosphatidyl-inositol-anchored membrane family-domain-containing protein n=1 Tax=Coniophora puteana (strain RWD-64-598) TaxID=741705 RepID=A0A5M3M856_CONPW|nr:uncharacterized protein CONPUDRAFT_85438 [Coniophora puteana RWD-64-598 SS2]EIW75116.1 hypothetical protein CONPUDRAFT_85438 [Coniophora puteana RWD-64-598 SS2]
MRFLTAVLASLSIVSVVYADPNPNEPGPGDVFIQGQTCKVGWAADTTGQWKQMTIELKTGDNFNMVSLMSVATVDGTDPTKTTFEYPCPTVSPHSPIYFYQFSQQGSANNYWTGRFTITDNAKDVVPPTQSTQPNGEQIPWGTGSIVGGASSGSSTVSQQSTTGLTSSGSSAGAPPPTVSVSSGTSAPAPSSGSGTSGSGTGSSGSSSGSPTPATSSPAITTSNSVVVLTSTAADSGSSSPTASPSGNSNGAASGVSTQGFLGRIAVALGAAALVSLL